MFKVAEIIRFYSLDEITEFINGGGEYPLHHVWCYDKIKENGIPVECIQYDKNSKINRIGRKLFSFNLQQQINLLKRSKEFDLIYAPFVGDIFLLALLKSVGLYKKPILGLGLESHVPYKEQFFKKLKQKIARYVYVNGIDSILYFNESIYNKSNEYGNLKENHKFVDSWGVDLDFFDSFTKLQTEPPANDYIHSTGGTERDYKTLISAFNDIDFNLRITTKHTLHHSEVGEITPNINVDNSIKPGLHSVGLIRKEYYNSLAVAIPLQKTGYTAPVGITVLLEALAMGKPILSTNNPLYPFNIEKEKVGFYIDHGDVEGWKQCVNYIIEHPDEVHEMGERGRYLCKKRYNYDLFSKDVISHLKKLGYSHNNYKLQNANSSV